MSHWIALIASYVPPATFQLEELVMFISILCHRFSGANIYGIYFWTFYQSWELYCYSDQFCYTDHDYIFKCDINTTVSVRSFRIFTFCTSL